MSLEVRTVPADGQRDWFEAIWIAFGEDLTEDSIERNLRVMDQTAIALCRENAIPIVVFDSSVPGNLLRVACGEKVGTLVGG